MADRCYTPEEIASVLDRADDPEVRAHLADCPACRSLVAAYRNFLAGDRQDDPAARAAERDLARRIEALTGGRPGRPRRRLGLALIPAAAVLAGVLFWHDRSREPVAPPLLRGAPTESTVAGLHAVRRADGSALLSWRRHGAADAYRVRILSPELRELAAFEAAGDTALPIDGALLALFAQESGGLLLWDVAPVTGGDVLSPSVPQIVPPGR